MSADILLPAEHHRHVRKTRYVVAGFLIWFLGWLLMFFGDGYLDIGNLGMLLVLISAIAGLCLPLRISLLLGAVSVLLFDWSFIPPRGTFTIHIQQHALMLLVMLVVNIIIASIMALLRAQRDRAARNIIESDILRNWSDMLHGANAPHEHFMDLQHLLNVLTGRSTTLFILKSELPAQDHPDAVLQIGEAGIEQRHALWYCLRQSQQLGRGTGRFDHFADVYLPLRARVHGMGAVLISNFTIQEFSTRVHLQTICDQMGNALERFRLHQQELSAREQAQEQLIRSNLLAAISHDYRTPLATIMSAASSLDEQIDKLDSTQQHQLAQRIFDEAEHLNRLTNNILQLARLDAGTGGNDQRITCNWESAEEIIGELLRRTRGRSNENRLHIFLEKNLPLLWCDAILIGQLLENLVDNAIKYSPAHTPIEIHVYLQDEFFLLSVRDLGDGIAPALRAKIFEPFQRANMRERTAGAGVGLAFCRAVAAAHGGNLQLESLPTGGNHFTCYLPIKTAPEFLLPKENAQ